MKLDRMVSIHCIRAQGDLIKILKKLVKNLN